MKRSPIRRVSKKRQREHRTRIANLRSIEADQAICERCGFERATDAHEVLTRGRGGSITDLENIRLLCRTCHDWVTEHPRQAHAEGLVIHSWEA